MVLRASVSATSAERATRVACCTSACDHAHPASVYPQAVPARCTYRVLLVRPGQRHRNDQSEQPLSAQAHWQRPECISQRPLQRRVE
jgi:hypothetical protein